MIITVQLPLKSENIVQSSPRNRPHIPGLDGLRGLAILSVLGVHLFWVDAGNGAVANQIYRLFAAGWVGVDLFFVLSGFLITGILIDAREKPSYFRNFYARRAVRIFPLYYGLLALGFVAAYVRPRWDIGHTDDQFIGHQWWLWTYMDNLRCVLANRWFGYHAGPFVYGHFWSLAVEEHYYLIWPLIVLACPPRKLLTVSLVLAAASAIARCLFVMHTGNMIGAYCFTPFRCESLLLGASTAVIVRVPDAVRWFQKHQNLISLIAVLLVIAIYPTTGWDYHDRLIGTVGYTVLAIFFSMLVMATALAQPDEFLGKMTTNRSLRMLGRYSYGIYALIWSFLS